MDDSIQKVYKPLVIADMPFPNQSITDIDEQSPTGRQQEFKQETLKDRGFPDFKIATELLSTALNTRNKRIIQEFQFTSQGAIQIGDYRDGESGDIRISPNGIVGRDISGNTTFALDATTGDAVFAGQVQTGTVIVGRVVVGDGKVVIDGSDRGIIVIKDDTDATFIDAKGVVSTTTFRNSAVVADALAQAISTSEPSWTDITNASFTFTLDRAAIVLIMLKATIYGANDCLVRITIDSEVETGTARRIWFADPASAVTGFLHRQEQLAAGSHTIKARATVNGGSTMTLYSYYFSYHILGK